jgi:hypothetical protein
MQRKYGLQLLRWAFQSGLLRVLRLRTLQNSLLHYLRSSNTFQRNKNGHNFFLFLSLIQNQSQIRALLTETRQLI